MRKHADKYSKQWNRHLLGAPWTYCNTPHEDTGEKPLYLLFGFDCRSPTKATLLTPTPITATEVTDYHRRLTESLAHARELAAVLIQKVQKCYKTQYGKKTRESRYNVGI